MFTTKHGCFDGRSWEELCQKVFRYKYDSHGYQHMPPSPGDFGLEGFTIHSGIGFQCYCPEKQYTTEELHQKQTAKITRDIKKLKTFHSEISLRLGSTKLREWHFVTPVLQEHELLAHAKKKETEARGWNLPILTADFTIHLRDADFYSTEINQVKISSGESLTFDLHLPKLEELTGSQHEYEAHIHRKSIARVGGAGDTKHYTEAAELAKITIEDFIHSTPYLKKIEADAPPVYLRILRSAKEFELDVREKSLTWNDTPEALNTMVKDRFNTLLNNDLRGVLDHTESSRIARAFVARWLAICQLDFKD